MLTITMSSSSTGSIADNVHMDSDEGLQGEKSGTIFPVDNQFHSEEDKAKILALPEVEREEILAERAHILDRQRQNALLLQKYENRQDGGKTSSRKRQAEAADLEGGRKSTRQRKNLGGRKVGEVSSSLEAYKEQRAKRGERKAAPIERRSGRSDSLSDFDAEGESDIDLDSGKPKQDFKSQYEEPADLVDFNRIHIGRVQFAKYCFYPTFEAAVKDCYVRVALGPEKDGDPMTYRMARIEGETVSRLNVE